MTDLISRQAAIDCVNRAVTKEAARWAIQDLPSAEPERNGYTKWIEDKLCECEPIWLCEDNDKFHNWCEANCEWTSIQPQCLRHIYEMCVADMRGDSHDGSN